MKRFKIDPTIDLIDFIMEIVIKEGAAIQDCLVVFPGKRPAHFLRKAIAQKIGAHQGPAILSIDQFIDKICDHTGFTYRPISNLDAVPEIFRINTQSKLIHAGERMTIDEFLPWGLKLFNDFEEMMIGNIDPETLGSVDKLAAESLPARISSQMIELSSLYRKFYMKMDELKLSTRAMRYSYAAKNIEHFLLFDNRIVVIAGFFAATACERKIFLDLDQRANTIFVFHKGPGIDQQLSKMKFECDDIAGPINQTSMNFYQASDTHGEVFGLNNILEKRKPFDAKDVIVIPYANTLFPIIHHSVAYSDEHNVSIGYPLSRAPVAVLVELLSNLMQSRNQGTYDLLPYLRYILHPYIKNTFFKKTSLATRIILHTIEKKLSDSMLRSISLGAIETDKDVLKECMFRLKNILSRSVTMEDISKHLSWMHNNLIRPFENIADVEDFARKLQGIFFFISEHSTISQHAYTTPFIETLLVSLDDIRTSGMKGEHFNDISIYFRFCQNYFKEVRHPFTGTPVSGLQVLGLIETRNIKFNRVFFLDANEGIIPRSSKEDTILPHIIRTHLGLPTYADREALSKYYFSVLLNGSREAHIFYVQGSDKERSRFVEDLVWQKEQIQGAIGLETKKIFFDLKFHQRAPSAVKKDKRLVEIILSKGNFSPSRLDVYLKCPLQYYYRYLLQLEEKAEIVEELESDRRGLIVHEILMRFFSSRIGAKFSVKKSDYQRLRELTESVYAEYVSDQNEGLHYLIRSQILSRITALIAYHQEPNFRELEILECENIRVRTAGHFREPPPLPVLEIETDKGRAWLSGRIDRIEKRNSEYYIVDYKTSSKAFMPDINKFDIEKRSEWLKTLKSVQLPCYYLLFRDRYKDVRPEQVNCSIMLLGAKKIEEKFLFKPGSNGSNRTEIYNLLIRAVFKLIEEIFDPEIDIKPTSTPDDHCPNCSYSTICGQQWISKKY